MPLGKNNRNYAYTFMALSEQLELRKGILISLCENVSSMISNKAKLKMLQKRAEWGYFGVVSREKKTCPLLNSKTLILKDI